MKLTSKPCFDMTTQQWEEICAHILSELIDKNETKIGHRTFPKMFGLKPGFYQQMVKRANASHPGFYFECPLKLENGDPWDPISFYNEMNDRAKH